MTANVKRSVGVPVSSGWLPEDWMFRDRRIPGAGNSVLQILHNVVNVFLLRRCQVLEGETKMAHDPRLLKHEDRIEELRKTLPKWITQLRRPATPAITPKFGPLEGIRVVSTGSLRSATLCGHEARRIWRGGYPR